MRYKKVVGTGGIGSGMLFLSDKMETLGRSESRLVRLSPAKDYCKQHIVFYYISTLLKNIADVYPIGFVGRDSIGESLLHQMEEEGMKTDYIGLSNDAPTMISICLQYPDKEGCNFTATNNAARYVTSDYVLAAMQKIGIDESTIVAAIPEVDIDARLDMLKYGKEQGAYCVLSIPAAEAEEFKIRNVFQWCDLLAVNQEEAQALANSHDKGRGLAEQLFLQLKKENADLQLLMTCGKDGAYSVKEGNILWIPPVKGSAVNTTGAGDAFLGGTIAGIARGLSVQKDREDSYFGETELAAAVELGALCAGMAVECEDSIALNVNLESIGNKIQQEGWKKEPWFIN